jgi:hypothetical protein
VYSYPDGAEAVALMGIAEAMIDGARKHMRARPVQEAVCYALSQPFDENNALFPDHLRKLALSLILELLRREPGSAGIQTYASLALANMSARSSGTAREAASAGAIELMLASHRRHCQDDQLQSNCLLAIARIMGICPDCTRRAAQAGTAGRFAEALKQVMHDGNATVHVAGALAQLHILSFQDDPGQLQAIESLSQLLQRYPNCSAAAVRMGATTALLEAMRASQMRSARPPNDEDTDGWQDMRASPEEAAIQAAASCALGRVFQAQPLYVAVAIDSGCAELLLEALRTHPEEKEVQAQVSHTIVSMMQALPASAAAIHQGQGHTLLAEAAKLHPEAEDVKVHVSTAFRLLGKFVPALTPFPFVSAEPTK